MDLMYSIIPGIITGWIAGQSMSRGNVGGVTEMVAGVLGAVAGGFAYELTPLTGVGILGNVLFAISGAIITIFLARQIINE